MEPSDSSAQRITLRLGGATLVLDKAAGAAHLHRKALLWERKPVTIPLADVCSVAVIPAFERSCGVASCYTLLLTRSGKHLELPAAARDSAEAAAGAIRAFLRLTAVA